MPVFALLLQIWAGEAFIIGPSAAVLGATYAICGDEPCSKPMTTDQKGKEAN